MSAVKKGDTLIEVVLSFVMFSLVAAVSIAVMHAGISGAEAAIELTLARVEIDSQSETMRFIQESFANDLAYKNLWNKITERALPELNDDGTTNSDIPELSVSSCESLYKSTSPDPDAKNIYNAHAFILNPRRIGDGVDPNKSDHYDYTLVTATNEPNSKFTTSSLNPRVIYTTEGSVSESDDTSDDSLSDTDEENNPYNTIFRAEGIYDFLVEDNAVKPMHYDLYVYTCWFTPGSERPTTIGTVTRVFNPEYFNE